LSLYKPAGRIYISAGITRAEGVAENYQDGEGTKDDAGGGEGH
jgi:hypothetical protein